MKEEIYPLQRDFTFLLVFIVDWEGGGGGRYVEV